MERASLGSSHLPAATEASCSLARGSFCTKLGRSATANMPRLPWPQTGPPSACQHLFAGCCHRPYDHGRPACRRHWQQVGLVCDVEQVGVVSARAETARVAERCG